MRFTAVVIASFAFTRVVSAQSCPPSPPGPQASAGRPDAPWFGFQVDKEATFIANDTSGSYPDEARAARKPIISPDLFLIQFVIDTTGVPRTASLKILRNPLNVSTDSVKVLSERWRYTPAIAKGCKVSQLVQTPLRWR